MLGLVMQVLRDAAERSSTLAKSLISLALFLGLAACETPPGERSRYPSTDTFGARFQTQVSALEDERRQLTHRRDTLRREVRTLKTEVGQLERERRDLAERQREARAALAETLQDLKFLERSRIEAEARKKQLEGKSGDAKKRRRGE